MIFIGSVVIFILGLIVCELNAIRLLLEGGIEYTSYVETPIEEEEK